MDIKYTFDISDISSLGFVNRQLCHKCFASIANLATHEKERIYSPGGSLFIIHMMPRKAFRESQNWVASLQKYDKKKKKK